MAKTSRTMLLQKLASGMRNRNGAPRGRTAHPHASHTIRSDASLATNSRAAQPLPDVELNQSRAELATVAGFAIGAMISLGPGQRIVEFNRTAEGMFGCSAKKAIGRPVSDFIPERFRQVRQEFFDDAAPICSH